MPSAGRERADFFKDVHRIEVRTGVRVRWIDAANHVVHFDGGTQRYDRLIFAAGAASVVPDIPGLEGATNVFQFRTLRDLQGITARLARGARRVTILGGGYFGIEAADGFLRRRCRVTIVERERRILARHSASMAGMASTIAPASRFRRATP